LYVQHDGSRAFRTPTTNGNVDYGILMNAQRKTF